jgi:signal transduction histidine kinase
MTSLGLEDPHRFIPEEARARIRDWDGQKNCNQNRYEVAIADQYFQVAVYFTPEFHSIRLYIIDISERKKAEQVQTDIFRPVAHDLANPIAAIQATMELTPPQANETMT